ncbi:hypothetical protein FNO01nite_05190 [Flavobacterium noncentrifugens]|uniref:YD repeat-containing protein n=1 Tax=Flavobacterium noncentrifugens TaxID=1128970 RepID=A0A1G8SKC8_9FLAO|nr:RHS repeat protein [Flavobacterium noncentrifugens]GEP49847.1 hypothetical protein FNO01nite_05190 [Flavobacterium noncentrifugens]SDJ29070.1 hypothetical protein SAMN04487935_0574 [Flavobacterium noncentrifugens]
MTLRERKFVFGILILFNTVVYSQSDGINMTNYNVANDINSRIKLPLSPEAAAFEKYGEAPVNMYSGTPDISVPLHTIEGRELSLPISLNYDATGVKVTQISTNVGLGWSINLGGRISRITNGKPDDIGRDPYSISTTILNYIGVYSFPGQLSEYLNDFMLPVVNGRDDTELDFYSLNVLGISDYIVKDLENGEYHTLLNPRIHVTKIQAGVVWLVTMDDGTQYYFGENGKKETTHISGGDDAGVGHVYSGNSESSWLLTKAISKNKMDQFDFDYKLYTWDNEIAQPLVSRSYYKKLTCPMTWVYDAAFNLGITYTTSQQMPLSIKLNGEYIAKFTYKSREDLKLVPNSYQGGNALNEILFYKYKIPVQNFEAVNPSDFYKRILFDHSYFGTIPAGQSQFAHLYRRLKLDKVTIFGSENMKGKEYAFDYKNPQLVPAVNSNSQDFLGLYNAASNDDLVQSVNSGNIIFSGADRKTDILYAQNGILEKIHFPTRGYSKFVYEQNMVSDSIYHPEGYYSHEVDIFTVPNYEGFYCGDPPEKYFKFCTTPNMIPINLRPFGCTEYSNYTYMRIVRTKLLKISEENDYNISGSGLGVYLIQNITGCDNDIPITFPECEMAMTNGEFEEYYPCLRPTESLYIDSPTNYSQPEDFVAGGCTGPIGSVAVNLKVGTYQVTTWSENNENAGPILNISKTVHDTIPAYTEYISKKSHGLRVKSIENYSSEGVIAQKKEYQYNYEIDGLNHSSGIELEEAPTAIVYQTKNIICNEGSPFSHIGVSSITPTIVVNAGSIRTVPNVAYSSVFEISKDAIGNKIYTQSKFNVGRSGVIYSDSEITSFEPNYRNGKISEKNYFNSSGEVLVSEKFQYDEKIFFTCESTGFRKDTHNKYAWADADGYLYYTWGASTVLNLSNPGPEPFPAGLIDIASWHEPQLGKYSYHRVGQNISGKIGWLASKEKTTFMSGGLRVVEKQEYGYDLDFPYMLRRKQSSSSEGIISQGYWYSELYPENPEKITDIITYSDNSEISRQKNLYTDYPQENPQGNFLTEVMTSKGGNALESRVKFDYEPNSKCLVSSLKITNSSGSSNEDYESYVYGYNNKNIVAKLTGVRYSQIPPLILADITDKSNLLASEANDDNLRRALNELRLAFPRAMITTYTFDPMVGITSETGPNGLKKFYEYDALGRLVKTSDDNRNILIQNDYHFKD